MAFDISNNVQLQRELIALNERLLKANLLLKKWQMSFEVNVQQSMHPGLPLMEIVIQARVGDKVYNRLLSPTDIEYFSQDQATITQLLASTFASELLVPTVIEELSTALAPALQNANSINSRLNSR